MKSNRKRLFRPHLIDSDGQIESNIFKDRLKRQDLIKNHVGLSASPKQLPEEELLVRGFASVLHQCDQPIIINHPLTHIQLYIDQTVGAKNGYLMSCGDYQQQALGVIHQYIQENDTVLEIGAGLGVTTAYLGVKSRNPITAVEPQKKLHKIIKKELPIKQC